MPNILIVDDEPSIVDNIRFALETEGIISTACTTADEGIKAFHSDTFDLIILDIGLPDMNGFELAKQIRTISHIPIIFLTARNQEIDRVLGLELGGDDYVTKPFSPRELSARVKAVLRRTSNQQYSKEIIPNHPTQNSRFCIDDEKMRISFYDITLNLSKTEYRLLQTLIKTPGRVYTRDQLMDHAWEHTHVSLDRTVDTHIKTIRQKLKTIAPDQDPIVTHRGIGYSLRDI